MHVIESPSLTSDELDDLLYLARVDEKDELQQQISELAQKYNCSPKAVLLAAQDPGNGNTILHYCSANGFLDLLQALLSVLKADEQTTGQSNGTHVPTPFINTSNKEGNTPLHWASLNGHLEVVKVLVESGADLSLRNVAGHLAVFEAERAGKGLVAEYLLEVGGIEVDPEDLAEIAQEDDANGSAGVEQPAGDNDTAMDEVEAGPSG